MIATVTMLRAYLELVRPANVTTALADVLAGAAVAGSTLGGVPGPATLLPLLASTACLYAGGIVLNDVFDRHVDRVERPERPIPSGRVPVRAAAALGGVLLAAGVGAAALATAAAVGVAAVIAALVLAYDAAGKRSAAIAPVNMGLCRAVNLLLGMAAAPDALAKCWPLALIPFVYIAGVTTLSRGEVHGGGRAAPIGASLAVAVALGLLLGVALRSEQHALPAVVLAGAAAWRLAVPFAMAVRQPAPAVIRGAVRRGILTLALLDATIAAAYAGPVYAAIVLATGLVAGLLARMFAVT